VSYIIASEDLIFFHISSNKSSPETVRCSHLVRRLSSFLLFKDSKRFGRRVRQSMEDMWELLNGQSSAAAGGKSEKKLASATA
jgi:hypothetical protein